MTTLPRRRRRIFARRGRSVAGSAARLILFVLAILAMPGAAGRAQLHATGASLAAAAITVSQAKAGG
jgi:hypothetical protein